MEIRHEERLSFKSATDAFQFSVTKLHNLVMSDECGIKHYKTDFLHDVIRITKEILEFDREILRGMPFVKEYRTVIGTRDCGTYTGDYAETRDYWLPSTIKGVGLSMTCTGEECTVRIYVMEPHEISAFVAEYKASRIAAKNTGIKTGGAGNENHE